jgi:AcrR family transcriptional regulator
MTVPRQERGESSRKGVAVAVTADPPRTARGAATRERILVQASRLFAVRGYFGTSTRDIADAVGIRQPSLFFHFATKQVIVEELLRYSIEEPVAIAARLLTTDAPAAVRIYRYIWFDTGHLLTSPYDLTGVHREDLMSSPEFASWRRKTQKLRKDIQLLVRQGASDGSLRELEPMLTQELISGMNLNTIRMAHTGRPAPRKDVPAFVAEFILRAILADPQSLPEVAAAALALPLSRDPSHVRRTERFQGIAATSFVFSLLAGVW